MSKWRDRHNEDRPQPPDADVLADAGLDQNGAHVPEPDSVIRLPTLTDDAPIELPIEESNDARLQALNAIGFGINGVNDALVLMMLERLLGEVATAQVKQAHQEWLSAQLDTIEAKVHEMQVRQTILRK